MDIVLATVIIAVGWFLIGYYTHYEFFETGYQDWIYHAFRVRDIAQYGIASWDHVWSNGINHWRAYQYIFHIIVLWMIQQTGVSVTHALLWVSAVSFIGIRVCMYAGLRYIGVNRLFSFFAVILSYTFSQQWIAIKELSIFFGLITVPFYLMLWIATLKNMRYVYILAAVTGALWSVHPVVGYSVSGMFFMLVLVNNLKKDIGKLITAVAVFFISSMPFTVPYFFSGYSFSNPFYATPQFMQILLAHEYMGLSLVYFVFLALSWVILVVKSNESPRWAKVLLVYCTLYLIFIYFGLLGYYPSFVNKFQFSRAIPFIALVLPFCFAAFLQSSMSRVKSRLIYTIFLVLTIASVSQSIEIASQYSGQPVATVQDPVAMYFADKDIPQGSIYIGNVSQSSYLSKQNLRFVTSYNEHLQPQPYSTRFNSLMKTDIAYTGVTDHQITLIEDHTLVLGVEYLFIPKLSPLVSGLTTDRVYTKASFEKVGEVSTVTDEYAVLHSRQPIAYAYAFDLNDKDKLVHFDDIPKPTLAATSYTLWDKEISRTAQLIRTGQFKSLPFSFGWPDRLIIDNSSLSSFKNQGVLVTQSYDQNWKVNNVDTVHIEPTNLRFMYLSSPIPIHTSTINLKNSWPWWHWPVQSLGIVMIVLTLLSVWVSDRKRRDPIVFLR